MFKIVSPMRKIVSPASAFLALALSLGCQQEAGADWQGAYFYEHEVGEGAGGVTSFIEYNLAIGAGDKCTLEIVGLQMEEQILCTATATATGDEVAVAFKSYADGAVKNALDVAVYPAGGTLFSLSKEKDTLITRWQALVPDGVENKSGSYFVPAK